MMSTVASEHSQLGECTSDSSADSAMGRVILVGAGPGAAGLMTKRGEQALLEADIVFFDQLVGAGVLAMIPPQTEAKYVGKVAGCHSVPQHDINRLLLEAALEGKTAVRLKGGDPFLFGRGGEELAGLKEAGVPFEVVPGVTSAIAAPAFAGIPVTHRGLAASLHIITAHRRSPSLPGEGVDYDALARLSGTLVFLMGVEALPEICAGLMGGGLAADTPAAMIQQGTTAGQRQLQATLGTLVQAAGEARIKAPAITVVGQVCGLSEALCWRQLQPLSGIRVLVTRPIAKASRLSGLLVRAGAEVVELPAVTIQPLDVEPALSEALGRLRAQDWLVLTSPSGVDVFFAKLAATGLDIRSLAGLRFAAIGAATATALQSRGIIVDLVPDNYSAADLGQALADTAQTGERLLLARAREGSPDLPQALAAAGLEFTDLAIYATVPASGAQGAQAMTIMSGLGPDDWVAFTSASTVAGFAKMLPPEPKAAEPPQLPRALCIGEQTAKAARALGFDVLVAPEATMPAMVDTLIAEVNR